MMPGTISSDCDAGGAAGGPTLDCWRLAPESLRLSGSLVLLGEAGGEGDSDLWLTLEGSERLSSEPAPLRLGAATCGR